ncbi:MAG: class I SAM-dependent methyltransferase [Candidatus Dormiibacterota bacterium]
MDVSDRPPEEREPQDQARVRDSYDAVATEYTRRVHDELRNKPLDRGLLTAFAEQIAAEFGAGAAVCDLGCGPGHVGAFLGDLGVTVTGIDLSPAMIEVARSLHPGTTFEVGTMTRLEVPDGRFAGIAAFYSIIHLVSDAEVGVALREFHRVLSERGLLLIAVHLGERGDTTHHADDMLGVAVDMDFRFFEIDRLISLVEAAGFRLEARTVRAPYPEVEVQTTRAYLLARRAPPV